MPADLVSLAFAAAALVARLHGAGDFAAGLSNVKDGIKAITRAPTFAKVLKHAEAVCRRQLEHEAARLQDGDVEAACEALEPLIHSAARELDIVSLASDSSLLRAWLQSHGGLKARDQLLSESSQAAYDILTRAITAYVAEVALQNPSFTTRGLQRILQQNAEIISTLKTLELDASRRGVKGSLEGFAHAYLSRIREQLDFVDLPGIDLERTRSRYRLSSAYTPLRLDNSRVSTSRLPKVDAIRMDDGSVIVFTPQEDDYVSFGDSDFSELTAAGRSILIVGEPGAGKSTLLKWLAVELATKGLTQTAGRPRVPILIKLRRAPLPLTYDHLSDAFSVGLVERKPDFWEEELLRSGEAVLLLDGLDEVAADQRQEISEFLVRLRRKYENATIVATSRPAAVSEVRLYAAADYRLRIEPMTASAINRFVREWHATVLPQESVALDDCLNIADQFMAKLESNSQLMRLAANPLLCAVMCALYHRRGHTLPGERIDLYNALMSLLLGRRDDERSVPPQLHALTFSVKERILERLADEFQSRRVDEVSREDVLDWLEIRSKQFGNPELRGVRPGLLLDHLVNRVGIIRELPDGVVDFWHKSFQEFLCARAIVNDARDHELYSHVADAAWIEVIRWAAGIMPLERANRLLSTILSGARGAKTDARYELALSCLHQAVEVDPAVRESLERHARRMLPPLSSVERSRVLRLGEVMVPYLEAKILDTESESHREACLAALIGIGGESANSALARCLPRVLPNHARTLLDGWQVLRSADYARRVLANLPDGSGSVHVTSVSQLELLPELSHLGDIDISLSGSPPADMELPPLSAGSVTLIGWPWGSIGDFCRCFERIRRLIIVNPQPSVSDDLYDFANVGLIEWERSWDVDEDLRDSASASTWGMVEQYMQVGSGVATWSIRGLDNEDGTVEGKTALKVAGTVRELYISECEVPPIHGDGLEELLIDRLAQDAVELAELPSLRRLEISRCSELMQVPPVHHLKSLEEITVSRCGSLRRLPVKRVPPKLARITVDACESISSVPSRNDRSYELLPFDEVDVPGRSTGQALWEVWAQADLFESADELVRTSGRVGPDVAERLDEVEYLYSVEFEDEHAWLEDADASIRASGQGYLIMDRNQRTGLNARHLRLDEIDRDRLGF